ncbi:hypothetical protein P43SY_006244 [Pythium insidiosum]|uniref:Uncharacterized protein n=1 Tax=Pythium insidiosum TaxID=114742 RepID=A0AAD5Q607_PYTIN|nr:hypothetical protein P43SY_006244 [Pythium insidiosum]
MDTEGAASPRDFKPTQPADDGDGRPPDSAVDPQADAPSRDVQNAVEATESADNHVGTASSPSSRKRPREDSDEELSGVENEHEARFSAAQVRAKVKRARLEASIALKEEHAALRFSMLELEQRAQDAEAARARVEQQLAALQQSMEAIVAQHRRTLNGMRDNLKLETLVASLETETAAKQAIQRAFQEQNAQLLQAQRRIQELEGRVTQYQKTETVLAQTVSHFQHQATTHEHQRAAQLERIREEVERQHEQATAALRDEMLALRKENEGMHRQLKELQAEHVALQASATAVLELQEASQQKEAALQERVASLETEKAVLHSKTEQVQKADAQLRSQLHARDERIQELTRQNDQLVRENKELTSIASDLMDMAEKQQAERQRLLPAPDDDGAAALERTRTRLRQSLG